MYELAVFITAPAEICIQRVEQREYEKHGKRILEDGDMHEQHLKFVDFVATRSLLPVEQWAETLACPIIRVNGTEDYRSTAASIAKRDYAKGWHRFKTKR